MENISAGVLLIGSLYWDNSIRSKWRDERLDLSEEKNVCAPIRYGRKSSSRDGTYTMVISPLCEESQDFGVAKAIPFKKNIERPEQLIDEAEYLWACERNKKGKKGELSRSWGAVSILFNPERSGLSKYKSHWKDQVKNEYEYNKIEGFGVERDIVNKEGCLQITWPGNAEDDKLLQDEPLQMDVLLATATKPNGKRYPTPEEIAERWNQNPCESKYFTKNIENGIQTFQDKKIKKHLKVEDSLRE